MVNLNEILRNTFISFMNQEFPVIWSVFGPYIIATISGIIIIGIYKFFGRRIVRFFSQISGDSKRETRRKEKKFCNAVDMISNLNDLSESLNKNNSQ